MLPVAPRIAILGQYKTGTTALFYQMLAKVILGLFEGPEAVRPATEPYLRHFNYGDDWAIASNPVVLPAHSSEYVLRTFNRRTQAGH